MIPVFLILSCNKPDTQFERLLKKLRLFQNAIIYVHHDFSQSDFDLSLKQKYNLIMPDKSYKTFWSHINNVEATWYALADIENRFNYDWLITLTPTCYPVKSISYIEQFLNTTDYDAFMEQRLITSVPVIELDKWIYRDMYHKRFRILKHDFFLKRNSKDVPFDNNFKIFHGSNYFMINRKTVRLLINQNDKYRQLVGFYKSMNCEEQHPCPQEIVLQSLILNNSSELNICNNYYRFIKWEPHKWSPVYLEEKYFDDIFSSDALFARKFKSGISDRLIEKIDLRFFS